MKIDWACRLGIGHSWKILDVINEGRLEQKLQRKYFDNIDYRPRITDSVLYKKVCTRCGKEIDEILEYTKSYIEENRGKQKNKTNLYSNYIY